MSKWVKNTKKTSLMQRTTCLKSYPKCDKDYYIGEYLEDLTCMKILAYDPVVTCIEIMDTTETASIDSNHNPNCWVIAVVHLAITCLLLLLVITVKYHIKRELAVPCLISY